MIVSLAVLLSFTKGGFTDAVDFAKPISIEIPVCNASQALSKLSDQAKVNFRVVGPAAKEILFLHVDNRPLREVLDKLALVTKSEWIKESENEYVLKRSSSEVAKEKDKQTKLVSDQVTEWRKGFTTNLEKPFDTQRIRLTAFRYLRAATSESSDLSQFEREDPVYRAFGRSLQAVDLTVLAKLRPAQRMVFSTSPTKAQYSLPSSIPSLLVEEQAKWSKEMGKISWKDERGQAVSVFESDSDDSDDRPIDGGFRSAKSFKEEPYLALVSITRREHAAFRVDFSVLSQSGRVLVSVGDDVTISSDEEMNLLASNWAKSLPLPSPSNSTTAFWNQSDYDEVGMSKREILEGSAIFCENPVKRDPLSVGNQELLRALGTTKRKSVIACIPDEAMIDRSPKYAFEKLFEGGEYTPWRSRESDNWVEFVPDDYVQHWQAKVDRNRLMSVSGKFRAGSQVDLRSLVYIYCGENGYAANVELANIVETYMTSRGMSGNFEISGIPAMLHLFASLIDSQMNRLSKGEIIPYQEMSASQLAMASTIVFGEPKDIFVGGKARNAFAEFDSTFELPNGIFDGPGIGAEFAEDDICAISDQQNPNAREHIENLADRTEAYVSSFGMCGTGQARPLKTMLFELRKQRRVTLRCYLSKEHWFADDFLEPIRTTNGRKYLFNQLSPALQPTIDKKVEFENLEKLAEMLKRLEELLNHKDLDSSTLSDLKQLCEEIKKKIRHPF